MVAEDAARVQELWANPDRVAASDLVWLEELVGAYPAAVPLWWLYVRAVQRAESPKFAQVLQRCAAISPDRSALMSWVEEPLIPQAKVAKPVPKVAKPESTVAKPEPTVAKPETEPTVAKPEPKVSKPEPRVAKPEPQAEVAKSEPKAEVPQSAPAQPKEIDLDSLPEKVRAQILRSRAIMAKIKGEEPAPSAAPAATPALAPAVKSAPEPLAPALVKSDAPESPVVAEPLAMVDAAPKPKPKVAAKAKQEEVPKPSIAAESAAPAAEGLSPFAQFVTRLSNSAASGPKAEDLIDEFLSNNPRISPLDKRDKDAVAPVVQSESSELVTGLVTETLARLYAEQGHAAKAIQAYEILKLRVPEKSLIFAARIEALRNQ
ncbi:MAG: hypothetical protein NWR20_01970 [Schleiferiaceae bacterium]|nr:hypothetical protein [Schleiferiaceae bacterium]MDP4628393.1 hypothetical protein [Schleiferiaceae bacterium]MDP4773306.1 hypothetical protein [Schleiferiaceae bacterium]MDP4854827.1 hypothetical protein [Schleiferiaceae bacterium]MDP4931928.1 hypothetical protein [Schleiferiaceae bacterium]